MEFWGVEVPAGKPTSCHPGDGMYLHVSQAALGESKVKGGKGNDRVVLKVEVDDCEVVLGTLSERKCDQMQLDLVFDREFKISHSSSSSSVYICGYRTEAPEEDDSEVEDEDMDEDEEGSAAAVATTPVEPNGVKSIKEVTAEAGTDVVTVDVKDKENKSLKNGIVLDGDSDEEDSDNDMDEDEDDEDEDEDDDEDSDESEEEESAIVTSKAGKKRSATELPTKDVQKKSKMDTSSKSGKQAAAEYWQSLIVAGNQAPSSGGKKGGKSGPVTPMTKETSKLAKAPKGTPTAPPPTPVSEKKLGQHQCTGCDRTFTTESAMSQHIVAKHKG